MDLVCLGELLIDFVPTVQGRNLGDVESFEKAAGGAPANVACGFSRLGGRSSFVGKVGSDEFGRFLEETLRGCSVDTSHLLKSNKAHTGLAFVSLRGDGERDFMFYRNPSADMLLEPGEVPLELIGGARIFHFGSVSLIADPARSATLAGAEKAFRLGKLVSFDPNLRPPLWPNLELARNSITEGLKWASVLKVSDDELEFVTGEMDQNKALGSLFESHANLRLIAVTLGGNGCTFALRDRLMNIPGFNMDVQDTTGAGDGFWAGVLFCLNRQMDGEGRLDWSLPAHFWEFTGRFANAVGALVVARRGAIPAMPDLETVERFLAERVIPDASL